VPITDRRSSGKDSEADDRNAIGPKRHDGVVVPGGAEGTRGAGVTMSEDLSARRPVDDDAPLPAYSATASAEPAKPRGSRSWIVASVTTVALLAGVVWATMPTRSRATKDPSTTSVSPTTAVNDRTISAGAPTDGKASKRLPVRLTPDKDLVDGQVVGIHGWGFTPGKQVGIVICTSAAQREGSAACDLTSYALSTVDANGEVQGLFTVRRFIVVAGQTVDCMNGAIDPVAWEPLVLANGGHPPDYPQFTCGGVIGEIDDYDNSGGWPMALAGETFKPLVPPPGENPGGTSTSTSSIVPSPTITGVAPSPPDDGRACPYPDPTFPVTTPSGTAPTTTTALAPTSTTLHSTPTTSAPRVDCDPINL
jgi:hypothetical protein